MKNLLLNSFCSFGTFFKKLKYIFGSCWKHFPCPINSSDWRNFTGSPINWIGCHLLHQRNFAGGAAFGLLGNRQREGFGRDSVVFFGYVVHMICFFLIFINSPDESPIQDTLQIAFLVPKWVSVYSIFSFFIWLQRLFCMSQWVYI